MSPSSGSEEITFVSDAQVRAHVNFPMVMTAVEQAFISLAQGESEVFEVVRGRGGGHDHFFGVKSARDGSIPALGMKVGSYAPDNHARGLPTHSSTTILVDDRTGRPFALVQANYLNGLRTAAANALAVRSLAHPDASTLGIIGIGAQAICEVQAVAHVRPIRHVLAVGTSVERRAAFAAAVRELTGLDPEFVAAEVAARAADVLVTVTPSRIPLVRRDWVRAGTHISAMGADNVGKQELDIDLVANAELWVDNAEQAARIGEAQHVVREGWVTKDHLRSRTLGQLLQDSARPRHDADRVTVFDSSGLAIQDIAAAHAALKAVQASGRRSG